MADSNRPESFLVADIGSVTTKIGLVDSVAGEYRFIAAGTALTTADAPHHDVGVGVRSAIRQIQARTERQLLTDDGQLISPERPGGSGVDALLMTTSAPVPLRVAIVGLARDLSVASAVRATHGTYATVEAIYALDETGGRWLASQTQPGVLQDPAVVAVENLAAAKPDVIILVGGVDGGAPGALYDLANLVSALASARDENNRPTVIFAGNTDARPHVAARIGQVTPLRVVDNVLPALERENLAGLKRELETLYAEKKITWLPGLNALTQWTPNPVVPTAQAFDTVVRFLARRYGLHVLGADIGGGATTIITANNTAFEKTVRADLGIGHSLDRLIAQTGVAALVDWLPQELSSDEAHARWLDHAARPWTIPASRVEAEWMHAAARVALQSTAQKIDADHLDLIVLTGGLFARNSNPGALALVALDALQPTGVFTLAVDALGLAPAFGKLALENPVAAACVIERDAFVTLGTVIAPVSHNREGQIDLRVKIQPASGGVIDLEVQHGSLELVPLMPGQKASIQVQAVANVYWGSSRGKVFKADVEGGALGLVIDARGRPVTLPSDPAKRRAKVQQWYWDIGGEVSYA
jgi:uncharacterized protein (TIGR01319 family)